MNNLKADKLKRKLKGAVQIKAQAGNASKENFTANSLYSFYIANKIVYRNNVHAIVANLLA